MANFISSAGGDPYYDKVVSLLPMNGTNGSTTFTDRKGKVWTTNGNSIISTARFKFGGSSGFFDGAGDFLSSPDSSDFEFGAGDFTIEAWIFLTGYSSGYSGNFSSAIMSKDGNTGRGWFLNVTGTASSWTGLATGLFDTPSTLDSVSFSHSFSLNQWYHVAWARQNNFSRLFVNGVFIGGATSNKTLQNTAQIVTIGSGGVSGFEYYFPGHITDIRVTKGIGRYIQSFGIPSSAFPSNPIKASSDIWSNQTKFLTRMEGTDNGTLFPDQYGHTIGAVNGDVKTVSSHLQYKPNYAVFNGSNDFWTTPNVTDLDFSGNTVFCVEMFVRANTTHTGVVACQWTNNGGSLSAGRRWVLVTRANGKCGFAILNEALSGFYDTDGSGIEPNYTAGQWFHLAFYRPTTSSGLFVSVNGTTQEFFVNKPITDGGTPRPITFGNVPDGGTSLPFNGQIAEIRLAKNSCPYGSSNFTAPIFIPENVSDDPFHSNTALVLKCDGINGSTSFHDLSKTPKTVTANGNAQISTSVVKYGTGSLVLDGTGDYLTIPDHDDFNFGSGDFTIESWCYTNSLSPFKGLIHQRSSSSSNKSFEIYITTGGVLTFDYTSNGSTSLGFSSPSAVPLSQWFHVAIVRSGSSLRMFVDGVVVVNTTISISIFNSTASIFIGANEAGSGAWNGYIDDFRITKGIARYTANFTPAEIPSITSLLITGKNGMVDERGHVLTKVGTSAFVASKYLPSQMAYFDGTGDYMAYNNHSDFNFGSSDFTVECFCYPNTINTTQNILGWMNGIATSNNYGWNLIMLSDGTCRGSVFQGGSQVDSGVTATLTRNTWNHVVFVRRSGVIQTYLNGVGGTTTAVSGAINNPSGALFYIAAQSTGLYPLNGFIKDVRLTSGLARYSANFTPPISKLPEENDPYRSSVVSLLHFNGTSGSNTIVDECGKVWNAGNGAKASNFTAKWGKTSFDFDGPGANDWIETLHHSDFNITGNITFEGWIYPISFFGTNPAVIIAKRNGADNSNEWALFIDNTSGAKLRYIVWSDGLNGTVADITSTTAIQLSTWTHVAGVRNGSNYYIFVDGVLNGSVTNATAPFTGSVSPVTIGRRDNNTQYFNGHMQDIRVTKGVARYTQTFVPPTCAFSNQ